MRVASLAVSLLLISPAVAQTARPPARPTSPSKPATAKPAAPAAKGLVGPDLPSRLRGEAPFCTINGEKIPISTYVDRLSLQFAPQIRDQLIVETLLRQEARARKLTATPAEVDTVSRRALEENSRRYGGLPGLEAELKRSRGWGLADFRQVIHDQAEVQVLREKLGAALVKAADIKDAELEPLYEQRKDTFRQPDIVRMSHILIRRPEGANEAQEKAARARAEGLLTLARAANGANFEALAREHSEDKDSGARGGKFPVPIPRDANPFGANFEAVVFSAPVGVVGEVVATPLGFHVIRVDAKTEGRYLALAEVREQLRAAVVNDRREKALDELFVRLRTRAKIETGKF